ncbi:MAG: hypothetical protein N2444_07175 [Methylocystis sp.]|nr:hypothetical protein [Methylocystis sp.]
MFAKLWSWLTLADYQEEKDRATNEIIARFSRRNVSAQNGWHMNDRTLEELSLEGDRAMANIASIIAKQTHAPDGQPR